MNTTDSINHTVTVNRADKWLVCQRLQELEISCSCQIHQPLLVEINTTCEAIQLWSVVKQLTATRSEKIKFLAQCWYLNDYRKD